MDATTVYKENSGETREERGSRRVSVALAILAASAFLIQFFNKVIGTYLPYGALLMFAMLLLVLPMRRLCVSRGFFVSILWVPMLCMVFLQLSTDRFSMNTALDLFTYFVGILLVFVAGNDSSVFDKVIRVIVIAASIYAISVFIQLLLPPIYRIYLACLRGDAGEKVLSYRSKYGQLTGFSTNPSFAAGHIVSGLLAYAAVFFGGEKRLKRLDWILVAVMFGALLLTGKRGHLLGTVFAILVCYLVNTRGAKRMRIVSIALIVLACVIPFLIVFGEVLMTIPGVGRLAGLFVGLVNGEDVTSGRSRLYAYAITQFKANPLFGIGWGKFRTSIVGVVTLQTELEVHNIYLQLLCETGLIGFIVTILPMVAFLMKALTNLTAINRNGGARGGIKVIAVFSLAYQLFFLVYGISGNPLLDYNYVLLYFMACAMTAAIFRQLRLRRRQDIQSPEEPVDTSEEPGEQKEII